MTDACVACQHTHVAVDVIAVGRFEAVPVTYRTPDGVIHQSRGKGQAHLCRKRRGQPIPPVMSSGGSDV